MPLLERFRPQPTSLDAVLVQNLSVQLLANLELGEWDEAAVRNLCGSATADAILHLPSLQVNELDEAAWSLSSNQKYMVKSTYLEVLNSCSLAPLHILSNAE